MRKKSNTIMNLIRGRSFKKKKGKGKEKGKENTKVNALTLFL